VENSPTLLDLGSIQLAEIRAAFAAGDFAILNDLLLSQALTLHRVGMDFIQMSASEVKLAHKTACVDIGLRALVQSQKTMMAMKTLTSTRPA